MKTREEYELAVAREQPKQLIDVQNGVYTEEMLEDLKNTPTIHVHFLVIMDRNKPFSAVIVSLAKLQAWVESWQEAKSWELARKNVSED